MDDVTRRFVVPDKFYRQLRSNWCWVAVGGLTSWAIFVLATAGFSVHELSRGLNQFLMGEPHLNLEVHDNSVLRISNEIRFGSLPLLLGLFAFICIFVGRRWEAWYEVHPDHLLCRLPYCRGVFQLDWAFVNRINVCNRADGSPLSLTVFHAERSPIPVMGLSTTEIAELQELIRERVPAVTQWTMSCVRLTWDRPWVAPTMGVIIVVPIAAMWVILTSSNVVGAMTIYALVLMIGAIGVWTLKPFSRRQNELKSLETILAICLVGASGLVTLLAWLKSAQFREFVDWVESVVM